ncbi:UPF0280 family protein, partial [bacterium]|nr:UPF0280 family protein [bacterium]
MRWKRFHIEDKETIVTLLCQPAYRMSAVYAMKQFRSRLEEVIRQNPEFRTSHIPLEVSQDGDEFIQSMLTASSMVRVGPMAGVAGAFAEVALEGLLHTGAPEAVVDNGGDIALSVLSPVTIGIYTGNAAVQNLGFKI